MRVPLLTFVVAGGGFSGVETAGAINDFLREAIKSYPHLSALTLRVVLVHSGERVLPELSEKLSQYATRKLEQHGIEVRLNTRVASAEDDCITLSDGTRIAAHTLMWTVGNAANPLLADLPCVTERGRVCVDEYLEAISSPGVWALGDGAHALDENGEPYPATAQHALRQGKVVACNIAASLSGEPKTRFRFKSLGQMATIGRRTGRGANFWLPIIAVLWPGWMWRTDLSAKLPRLEKTCARVALDCTPDQFFSKDLVQHFRFRVLVNWSRHECAYEEHTPGSRRNLCNEQVITAPVSDMKLFSK
jgi:NADH dehydrogenase